MAVMSEDAVPRASPAATPGPGDDGDEHDRGLILERLGWSVNERLDANASFMRFYLSIRPDGPIIRGE